MRTILTLIMLMLISIGAQAEIVSKTVSYSDGETQMKGYIAYDDSFKGQMPGVIVVHEWWGHNEYARHRARMLAEQGYVALAVDMYGDGVQADHPEDAMKFSRQLMENFPVAESRFNAGLTLLRQQVNVDIKKLAAAGYCFGGSTVLQLARQGLDVDVAAVFHGSLLTRKPAQTNQVKARVLVFNGDEDPMVKPEHISGFKREMSQAKVDYQFVSYPGAKHAFTNPSADELGSKFSLPLGYNKNADQQSWSAFMQALKQAFK